MKTRTSDQQPGHGLPPPPAPTARDANPWQMSSGAGGSRPEPRGAGEPGWPPLRGAPRRSPAAREPRTPWIPLLILLAVLGAGVRTAIDALSEGDVETAIAALVIFAVVAVVGLRRLLKQRNR